MKQRLSLVLSTLILAGLLLMPLGTAGQGRTPGRSTPNSGTTPRSVPEAEAADVQAFRDRLAARSGPVAIFVELDADPVVETVARAEASGLGSDAASAEGQTQLARIERSQRSVANRLQALDPGAVTLFQVQRVANGIGMRVDAGSLADVMKLPGVSRVSHLPLRTRDNSFSSQLIGAPTVWNGGGGANGATGRGIRIGSIDTGIDYHHVNFGGPGDGYAANDPTIITDTPSAAFFGPNAPKVKGGFDFAGDAYDGSNEPTPDPDPIDCLDPNGDGGHGTHVAGTAAGFGTTSAGARFTGPYNSSINFTTLRIGPGVAPEADLYALRVFGCSGSTNLVIPAIEWSVDPNGDGNFADRLDLVNLSLGSDYGRPDDPDALAADTAAKAGVIVVFSAGNSGNTTYVSGGPGASSHAITVASSDDGADIVDAIRVNSPAAVAGAKPVSFSIAYPWATSPDVSGDLIYIPGPGTSTGCNVNGASPYSANQLQGRVLLVDWAPQGSSTSPCGSVQRSTNAANAGAAGIIMASGVPAFDASIIGSPVIPAVFTTFTVGEQLKGATGTVGVTFSNSLAESQVFRTPDLVDTLSDFSSRGPRGGDSFLKPDLAAPGQGVYSAESLSGSSGATLSGTSMAAPQVAGMMALLRELKPALSVPELKALAMNTAVQDVYGFETGKTPYHAVQRVGAGRIDVPRAAAGTVIAYDAERPELVSVSFGNVEVVSTTTLTRTVTVKNFGAAVQSYGVGFTPDSTIPGVSYSVSPATISVPAGGTASISVVMRADPAQMRHISDELVELFQGNPPSSRHFIAEAAGTIDLRLQAPTTFLADALGRSEVPPNNSTNFAAVQLAFNAGTANYDFRVTFDEPITLTASHLHRGPAGANGGIVVGLLPAASYQAGVEYTGAVTLNDADRALLAAGGLYANFHTAAFPNGELRGQVVAAAAPDLRLGVYATARPAATMSVAPRVLSFGAAITGTKELTFSGIGRSTGTAIPTDVLSLATLFELQKSSGNGTLSFPPAIAPLSSAAEADLSHIGVSSNADGNTTVVSSTIFFGLASHKNWSSPNTGEFDIYIDTNNSGIADDGTGAEYLLFNFNTGSAASLDPTDLFTAFLVNLSNNRGKVVGPVNVVPASTADTQPFNTNVMVLPVPAAELGLTNTAAKINYRIFTLSVYSGFVDDSGLLSYDVAKPGVSFTSAAAIQGTPAVADLPTTKVAVSFNKANFEANRSQGVLILHHHNTTGTRVETVLVNPRVYLPILPNARAR